MTTTIETVISVTGTALEKIVELRISEGIDDLHLGIRISGVGSGGFIYETAFLRPEDVRPGDHVEYHGDLPVAIPLSSLDDLRGAELDLATEGPGAGLVIRNPNTPSPTLIEGPPLELTGTPEEKVRALLDERINPGIAAHGGVANLIAVEGSTAKLELGGGCQGCGLAAVTLRQGIEKAIIEAIPEITHVVDVTDHTMGENPYF